MLATRTCIFEGMSGEIGVSVSGIPQERASGTDGSRTLLCCLSQSHASLKYMSLAGCDRNGTQEEESEATLPTRMAESKSCSQMSRTRSLRQSRYSSISVRVNCRVESETRCGRA